MIFGFAKLFVTWATGEYINYHPMAIVLEYPVACGLFALGGLLPSGRHQTKEIPSTFTKSMAGRSEQVFFLYEKKSFGILPEPGKLRVGYLIGVLGMGVAYIISAVLYYPPDRVGFWPNLLYCIKYDMSYLPIEAGITILILFIPQIPEALYYLNI